MPRGGYRPGAGPKLKPDNNTATLRGKIQSAVNTLHESRKRMQRLTRQLDAALKDDGLDGGGVKTADTADLLDRLTTENIRYADTWFHLRGLRRLQAAQAIDETQEYMPNAWEDLGREYRFGNTAPKKEFFTPVGLERP